MRSKKSNFPDYWGVQRSRSRKIPVTPVIRVFKQDKRTDTDRDGVPNYRDCNPWNPLRQDDFFTLIENLDQASVNAKPVKHQKIYDYLKNTIKTGLTIGNDFFNFSNKAIAETLSYVRKNEGYYITGEKRNGKIILFLEKIKSFSPPKGYPRTKAEYIKWEAEGKRKEQYLMKRDTLALKMHGEHFSHLTAQQQRDVTRKFDMMMR